MQETLVRSLGWEDPLEKEMATHVNNLAGKSHAQRSLADCSPQGYNLATKQQQKPQSTADRTYKRRKSESRSVMSDSL